MHGPVRIVVVINDEGVEQAFGLRNFRISGMSPTDGYATEDDLSCAILSALSRPLPAPAINAFLRLPPPTRAEFLEGRGLDEDLALDELCQLGLKDLLPPTREARVESFEDDSLHAEYRVPGAESPCKNDKKSDYKTPAFTGPVSLCPLPQLAVLSSASCSCSWTRIAAVEGCRRISETSNR